MQAENVEGFNFPEIRKNITLPCKVADVYSGNGIRKIKAYISDISEEDLLRKRTEYWETRIEGDLEVWNTLRMCCSEETTDGIFTTYSLMSSAFTNITNIFTLNSLIFKYTHFFFLFISIILLDDALMILQTMGIKLYKNCINVVFDAKGDSYEIPNYCINMPYKYELKDEYKRKKLFAKEKVKVKFP